MTIDDFTIWLIGGLGTVFLSGTGYLYKTTAERITVLEDKSQAIIDEVKVRQLVDDKLAAISVKTDDIKDDIREIKIQLGKIIDAQTSFPKSYQKR